MKVKIVLFSLLFTLSTFSSLQAQDNELKLGYGVLSGTEIAVSIGSSIGVAIGTGLALKVGDVVSIIVNGTPTNVTVTSIEGNTAAIGTFYLGFNRYLSERFSIGTQLNYNPIRIDHTINYSNGDTEMLSTQTSFLSLYGRMDFRYVARPKFQLYSALMLGGIMELDEVSDGPSFALHFTALGARFGEKHAFFAELGVGLGPFISGGYSSRF